MIPTALGFAVTLPVFKPERLVHTWNIFFYGFHCKTYTPRNEVRGGILESPCPSVRQSVRLSSAFGFPAHNCFPFTPIIMTLHMQTPHESRMYPIDFEVQRSRSQCINYWKWFPAHNYFLFTPIIMKLHMQTPHESRMCLEKLSPRGVFVPLGQPRSSSLWDI